MKIYFLFLAFIIALLCLNLKKNKSTMNPIIGDNSLIHTFGTVPADIPERLRVQTHLRYVETLLRKNNCDGLAPELNARRLKLLDLLHLYSTRAVFPENHKYEGRKPCFIDEQEKICAVGFLVEQTEGLAAAQAINKKHQYEEIMEMKDPVLEKWIKNSGLSKKEVAMIQPTYNYSPPAERRYFSLADGLATGFLSGFNFHLMAANFSNSRLPQPKKSTPRNGIIFGALQVALGTSELIANANRNFYVSGSDLILMQSMGIANIIIGTTATFISIDRRLVNIEKRNKSVSLNLINLRKPDGAQTIGVYLRKSF